MTNLNPVTMELFKALATGFVTGAVFAWMKLPIPAPPVLSGIVGIIGIYLGYLALK